MSIKQYKIGKSWEEEIMEYYNKRKYYTYKFPTEFNGTICDILVSKNSSAMFIEAKHTTKDKLSYKASGLYKKRDEIDNFVRKYGNDVWIMIKSDIVGNYWLTWSNAKPILEEKGYLDLRNDCIKMMDSREIMLYE